MTSQRHDDDFLGGGVPFNQVSTPSKEPTANPIAHTRTVIPTRVWLFIFIMVILAASLYFVSNQNGGLETGSSTHAVSGNGSPPAPPQPGNNF